MIQSTVIAENFLRRPDAVFIPLKRTRETLLQLKRYLYLHKIFRSADVQYLYRLSSKLKIENLQRRLAGILLKDVNEVNLLNLLYLAVKTHFEKLREKCMALVCTLQAMDCRTI